MSEAESKISVPAQGYLFMKALCGENIYSGEKAMLYL